MHERSHHLLEPVAAERIVLHRVSLPMRGAFVTAHGTEATKEATIVEMVGDGTSGWAECVALARPDYTSEYADGAFDVLDRFLAPAWLRHPGPRAFDAIVGHPMAKASVELAGVDLGLRRRATSLAAALGITRARVPSGVVVGLGDAAAMQRTVAARVAEGYRRVKLKIDGHTNPEAVAAIVAAHPGVAFAVDANASLASWRQPADSRLRRLDDIGLQFIEQPLATDDLDGHAQLARDLATPLCLDEPLTSLATVQHAVTLGAATVVNLKPGRVGGLTETLAIHDWCRAEGVAMWMGGMLETGIGRALNIVLAALDGFTLPGDLAATSRYFDVDLVAPFELDADGCLTVPDGLGIGVEIDREVLDAHTVRRREHVRD